MIGPRGRGRGDHPGAAAGGDLAYIMTDSGGAARHQQGLAGDLAMQVDRVYRRQARYAKTSADGEINALRQGYRLRFRQSDELGGRAESALPLPVPQPNALRRCAWRKRRHRQPRSRRHRRCAALILGAARGRPARLFTSEGLTPETLSLTNTSWGAGRGFSSSPTVSTSCAGPFLSYQAAFIQHLRNPREWSGSRAARRQRLDHVLVPWRFDVGRHSRDLFAGLLQTNKVRLRRDG